MHGYQFILAVESHISRIRSKINYEFDKLIDALYLILNFIYFTQKFTEQIQIMKLKKYFLILSFFTIYSISFSQQIGSGFASPLTSFNVELPSGFYQGLNPNGKVDPNSHDWNHLLNLRHANPDNNSQLQLASSYAENDRLFLENLLVI